MKLARTPRFYFICWFPSIVSMTPLSDSVITHPAPSLCPAFQLKSVFCSVGRNIGLFFVVRPACISIHILYKALIRSIMVYACPTWEYAADVQLFKTAAPAEQFSALLATLTGAYRPAKCTWP
jgi:hypothetical protein